MWSTTRAQARPPIFSSTNPSKALKRLLDQIERTNRRHRLIRRGDRLIAGVSGGPDSVALLELLSKLRQKYSLAITAAHLDHGFVKTESRRFLRLVQKTCKRLGVPLVEAAADVKKTAKEEKRSLEETGRILRYRFFERAAAKTRSQKIVTAHTLDDQAETMLLRLIRGSGLRGLNGIPYRRGQGVFTVIRPLLDVPKRDLTAFLNQSRVSYCRDATNRDSGFTRNRVRLRLLPALARDFNPRIRETLGHLSPVFQETQDFIRRAGARALARCAGRSAALDTSAFCRLHPALRSEVLLQAIEKINGNSKKITREHLTRLCEMAASSESRLRADLPGGLSAEKKGALLRLRRAA